MFGLFRKRKPAKRPVTQAKTPARAQLFTFDGPTMGTRYQVACATALPVDLDVLKTDVHGAVDRVDQQMSNWIPTSPLSQFNRAGAGVWVDVPQDLITVVQAGLKLGRETRGAFDLTAGQLVDDWGFGPSQSRNSQAGNGAPAGLAGSLEVRQDPPALKKSQPLTIDLCGIAKGFGVDQIAACLESHSITDYLVTIDGEARVSGRKPGLDWQWSLALDAPVAGQKQAYDILTPRNGALATSGDYRHFVDLDGQRFAHTMDMRVGAPVQNAIASLTVHQETCMMADAWATALMVLGPKEGVAVAEARKIPALFLIRGPEGIEELATAGFRQVSYNE